MKIKHHRNRSAAVIRIGDVRNVLSYLVVVGYCLGTGILNKRSGLVVFLIAIYTQKE
jgi:hypothetical protein